MNIKFRGAGTALITPFHRDGSLDLSSLEKLVEQQISNHINYLVILGTTGESPTIRPEERRLIKETVCRVNNGRVPLVLGIGGNDTYAVRDSMLQADLEGIDAILSVAPYYNKPNQRGLVEHYRVLADSAPKPLIIYNVPGRTGANMLAQTQLEIAEFQNVIATKEASGNVEQCMEILRNKPADFLVISGDDALTFPYLALGMDGVISVATHAFPYAMSRMVNESLNGNWSEARAIHYKLLPLMQEIFADGSPGGIKVMLEEAGICKNVVRLPLMPVRPEIADRLRQLYRHLAEDERLSGQS
ncbi:MAG: 4-hydroxy-tetrahydrodipicolinate synthase [Bacteroidetes bacterium]|nr:4-hydroxy-tetrahydrodipicolinate synthase [Bacteroidota bacterium]